MMGIASLPWRVSERWALMTRAMRWRQQKFSCAPELRVADLCAGLPTRVLQEFIEPLCVSALNTPTATASAQVFLRVLQDALLGPVDAHAKSWGLPSHLLIPRTDLGHLFPERAAQALAQAGATLRSGERAQLTCATVGSTCPGWQVQGEHFDAVVLATSASDAIKLLDSTAQDAPENIASHLMAWRRTTQALRYEPIATVYAYAPQARLKAPMLALHSSAQHPAQFVFDRGQLHPAQHGLLAFVVSASRGDAATLQTQVLAQAQAQLGLSLAPVKTLVEKRATFACTPGLERPSATIAPGLLACGDYLYAPDPATLEGAVRSGMMAALALSEADGFSWKD
jgi:predicted NAD/FAD-dependent oxidoreductase